MSTDHNFWRERRAEVDSNWGPSAYQPNALPLGQTGSHYHDTWPFLLLSSHLQMSTHKRLCCTFCGPAESSKVVHIFFFDGPFLGPSLKGEHPAFVPLLADISCPSFFSESVCLLFCKLCRKDSGQYGCQKHIKSRFRKNNAE